MPGGCELGQRQKGKVFQQHLPPTRHGRIAVLRSFHEESDTEHRRGSPVGSAASLSSQQTEKHTPNHLKSLLKLSADPRILKCLSVRLIQS